MLSLKKYYKKNIKKSISKSEFEYGHQKEKEVMKIINHLTDENFSWIRQAWYTEPNSEEDRRGIDIVVDTFDIGKIFIQVKGSKIGLKRFSEKRSRMMIAILYIPHYVYMNNDLLTKKIKILLDVERQKILQLRCLF